MKKLYIFLLCGMITFNLSAQNVGIGTASPAQKLDVVGNVKVSGAFMPGGAAGNTGQVLVSNGAGNAPTWQTLTTLGSSKFFAGINSNSNNQGRMGFSISSGVIFQSDSVEFINPRYNVGADFTVTNTGLTNNYIQVNTTGLYHFEGSVRFAIGHGTTGLSPNASVSIKYHEPAPSNANVSVTLADIIVIPQTDFINPFNYTLGIPFKIDIYFLAGTTFNLTMGFNNLTNYPLGSIGIFNGYISGYKISD